MTLSNPAVCQARATGTAHTLGDIDGFLTHKDRLPCFGT